MSGFSIDKQTLDDLNLAGRFRKGAVIGLFDRTRTRQGRMRLEAMFRNPLTDAQAINARSAVFRYFHEARVEFPFGDELTDAAEFYIGASGARSRMSAAAGILAGKVRSMFVPDGSFAKLQEGMSALLRIIGHTAALLKRLPAEGSPIRERSQRFFAAFGDAALERIAAAADRPDMPLWEMVRLDGWLRADCGSAVADMMDLIYDMDLCISVASAAAELRLTYAEAQPAEAHLFEIKGVRHISLADAVPNDITIDDSRNLYFLTGINMAGKSTFMKAVSIATYLAHAGFPVAAESMRFSPIDGICTSINVPDNIEMGYSHFYAEVLRVKHIAELVGQGKRLLVVFDELFKGTNVKDAFDATLAVTAAFASHAGCRFIVSTHIVEVGEALAQRCANVQFHYFPTGFDGSKLLYPYRLEEGISHDRHGMTIIRNEGILDIIAGCGDRSEQKPE